jgi:hypothetical protein
MHGGLAAPGDGGLHEAGTPEKCQMESSKEEEAAATDGAFAVVVMEVVA